MTGNATLRNITSERAQELSNSLARLAKKYQHGFKNFDVNYMDCPIQQVLKEWEEKHGKGSSWQLIEAVDGFHPNTIAETKFANLVYSYLEKHLPHYLGPINPNNKKIELIFGDQGGY